MTSSEGKFVLDLIANSDLSPEKSVTILTMMEKNKGKISESEAKKVFGSNTNYDTDIIELMYRTNILYGMNIAQIENAMQDQRMYNTYGLAAAMTATRVVLGVSIVRNEATSSGARTWEQATKSKPSAPKPPADKAAGKSAAGGSQGTPQANKKFSNMSADEQLVVAKQYAQKAPIEIPESAAMKAKSMNNGYEQITYNWNDGTYKYEVRWHSRTPGAPVDQGNTWVVQRKIPGSGGQKPQSFFKIGENEWV